MANANGTLKNVILRGVGKIAKYRDEKPRRTYSLLARGLIPGKKEGKTWVSTTVEQDRYYGLEGRGE